MILHESFGVDLGSDTIKIYSMKKDEILIEKNMIAIRNNEEVLAIGNDAYEMYEKAPHNIEVTSPMRDGMIANIGYLEVILHLLLKKISKRFGRRPVIYFSIPMNMTEIEKRAYHTIAGGGDLRKSRIYFVERPIANTMALGIPVMKSKGSMIAEIGADSIELSVLAEGRVILSKQLPLGGNKMDEAIVTSVRKRCGLYISHRMAARLKAALAGFSNDMGNLTSEARIVVGVDTLSGLPKEGIVKASYINEAILPVILQAAREIKLLLERIPPQTRKSIVHEGIYLTGGCTKIANLGTCISQETGCTVHVSQYSDLSTIYGLKEIMTHKTLHHWALPTKNKHKKYRY